VTNKTAQIDADGLAQRLGAFPGIARLREAAAGIEAYVVGGAVRDALLGAERADLDLVVEGDIAPLAEALGGELREHERFSTATVRNGSLHVDLARSRAEEYEHPGALPEVHPAPLADDLARRDFTVNAMAIPLTEGGELIDPQGGLDDLKAGLLRVLHPRSFFDDPTRALRAARYAARLGFELEPGTAELLRGTTDLCTVSEDRVDAELLKIAAEPQAARALELLGEWGVLDVDDYAAELVRRLDALLAAPPWAGYADRVGAVAAVARGAAADQEALPASSPGAPSAGRRLAAGHTPEALAIGRARGASWLDDYAGNWRHVELEIDGGDLIEAGVEQGPALGRGLRAALDAKLDGDASGREQELAVALRAARGT
jgi:tRNA nucleotidyltransferase (CCA-adding enzyme)